VECGDHYARALASWGVYLALAGFAGHGPRRHIAFAPRITPGAFRAAFTSSEGWGTYEQEQTSNGEHYRVTLRWGQLPLKSMAIALPEDATAGQARVTLSGRRVGVASQVNGGTLQIAFDDEITLLPGDTLSIERRS